jgi:uncharacterized protein (DUF433 family)
MSKVLSLRLKDDQMARLQRVARQLGRRPSDAAALLLEEAMREREFAFIEFRDSLAGRQPYLKGTRLAVWWVASIAPEFGSEPERMAKALWLSPAAVGGALAYAAAYPAEIQNAIDDSPHSAEDLKRLVPQLAVLRVNAAGA